MNGLVYLLAMNAVFDRLRERHPVTYNLLNRPKMGRGGFNWPTMQWMLQRGYKSIDDRFLKVLADLGLVTGILQAAGAVLLLAFFSHP
ncbi:hypothetical protein [Paraburkholderia ginsengiterrae]|nr:hypothetical protein [Paraburkholderia ginsengiterrae]